MSGYSAVGSAFGLGPKSRAFESPYPDHFFALISRGKNMKPACHGGICNADEDGSRLRFIRRQPGQVGPADAAGLRQVQRTCTLREILFAIANSNFPSFGIG